jgi:hypothetical protein
MFDLINSFFETFWHLIKIATGLIIGAGLTIKGVVEIMKGIFSGLDYANTIVFKLFKINYKSKIENEINIYNDTASRRIDIIRAWLSKNRKRN